MKKEHTGGSVIGKVLKGVYSFNAGSLCIVSTAMFLLMCVEVFIRYIFRGDLRAMEEYIYFFLMWMVMLGSANAVLENSHLRSDTLTMLIKNKQMLNTLMIVVEVAELAIYCMFAYYSFLYMLDAVELPTFSRVLRLPKMIGQSSVFYGGVLMMIFGIFNFCKAIRLRLRAFRAYRSGELAKTEDISKLKDEENTL